MQVAFYKGPATDLAHKISHSATCWWTNTSYSHCEIEINGTCYSSSARDKGVRAKQIDLNSGKWDLIQLPFNQELEDHVLELYDRTQHCKYDYAGVGRFVFPFLPNIETMWYCSEWCAYGLRIPDYELSPGALFGRVYEMRTQ